METNWSWWTPERYIPGLLSVPRRREFLGILSTEWKDGCTQRLDLSLFYLGKFQNTRKPGEYLEARFIHSEGPAKPFPASLLLHGYFNDMICPRLSNHRIPNQWLPPCKNRPLVSNFVANQHFVQISPQPRVHPVALGHVHWRIHGCQGVFPFAPWKQSRKLCISKFRIGRKAIHWLIGADEFWFESQKVVLKGHPLYTGHARAPKNLLQVARYLALTNTKCVCKPAVFVLDLQRCGFVSNWARPKWWLINVPFSEVSGW